MNLNRTTLDRTSERELLITRAFQAPAAIVFDAFTKPEHVRRWWAPKSRNVAIVSVDADVRPGGAYRYVLSHAGAPPFAFSGKYIEVDRPTRIVYTQTFEPQAEPATAPDPNGYAVSTVLFEERDGKTLLSARELYPSKEVLDAVIESGMEGGMRETFELLDQLVGELAR